MNRGDRLVWPPPDDRGPAAAAVARPSARLGPRPKIRNGPRRSRWRQQQLADSSGRLPTPREREGEHRRRRRPRRPEPAQTVWLRLVVAHSKCSRARAAYTTTKIDRDRLAPVLAMAVREEREPAGRTDGQVADCPRARARRHVDRLRSHSPQWSPRGREGASAGAGRLHRGERGPCARARSPTGSTTPASFR